ncbi:MAG: RNA-binding protein [Sphingobacteriaceae bacterium]|nr:RNA-binding protein [Sphingobacteriaceae bacterium]
MNANENYGRDDRSRRTNSDANAFNEDRQARLERLQRELRTLEEGSDDQKSKLINRDLDRSNTPRNNDFAPRNRFGNDRNEGRSFDRPRGDFNRDNNRGEGRSFDRPRGEFNRDSKPGEGRSFDRPRPDFNRDSKPGEGRPFDRPRGEFNRDNNRGEGRSFDRPRPDFNRDNNTGEGRSFDRPRGDFNRDSKPSEGRSFDRPRPDFNRDSKPGEGRSFDRPRGDFNRDGNREGRSFDRPRPDFNRDSKPGEGRSFDRPRGDFNRDGNREGRSFDRPRPDFNRDSKPGEGRSFDRPRGDFNRDGNREGRSFDRPRPDFNRDSKPGEGRSFDRPRGDFNRDSKPGEGRSFDRPRGDFNRDGNREGRSFDRPRPRFGDDRGPRSFDRNGSNDRYGDRKPYERDVARMFGKGPEQRKRSRPGPLDVPAKPETIIFDGPMRLNRYIANSGICSRRRADELIAAGEIFVNGAAVTELGSRVNPGDTVTYQDKALTLETLVYVLLNKPKDFITTLDDPEERRTVMSLVKNATEERIVPVGRLDRNTTGLLVLTNDGELTQKLTHPSNNIAKVYDVVLNKELTQADFTKITEGVTLEDGLAKVDAIAFPNPADKTEVGLEIHSGRNRIVRRIFESLGYDVVKLDRVYYAGLTKKDLPRGNWRYLSPKEITRLKSM